MLPDKAKFVECSIIRLALSFWMKHLAVGQLQKNFYILGFSLVTILKSVFHCSAFGNQQGSTFTEISRNGLIRHTGCLITLSDRNGPIHDLVYPILTIFLT